MDFRELLQETMLFTRVAQLCIYLCICTQYKL